MIKQGTLVRKRDGRITEFDAARISRAVANAFRAEQGLSKGAGLRSELQEEVDRTTTAIMDRLSNNDGSVDVETIQDLVEEQLMRDGNYRVARRYIVYREEHKKARMFRGEPVDDGRPSLKVRHDDGSESAFESWRIRRRIEAACQGVENVDPGRILDDALGSLYDGITPQQVQRATILAARTHIEADPNYGTAAARLLLGVIYHEAWEATPAEEEFDATYRQNFSDYLQKGIEAGRLSSDLLEFDLDRLSAALSLERDDDFTYLGLQTIYDRYLIEAGGRRIECPQYFWMRVAMGLSLNEDDREGRAIEFYEMLSAFRVVSATPTLFNSGTQHPQLSSCYLTTVGDDLESIFKAVSDNAKLSKWAGGLGNDWTNIRATGSVINGTGGESQGVIPFLKIVNDTAVAVNQCFTPDTPVFTADGVRAIKDIRVGDLVLGRRGEYREVLEQKPYNQMDSMVELNVKHSVASLKVTAGHPLWAIQDVPNEQSIERTVAWLEKGKVDPKWVEAGKLGSGDYIAQVIPSEVVPVDDFTEDDARFYGILLGDGHLVGNGYEWGVSGNPSKDEHLQFVCEYLEERGVHFWKSGRDGSYAQVKWSVGRGVLRDGTSDRFVGAGEPTVPFDRKDIYDSKGCKHISRRFSHLPRRHTLALIRGLLETDGGVSRGKETYFTNSSYPLVEGLRYQLLRLGIPCAGQYREREQNHTGTRTNGEQFQVNGLSKAYGLRVPAVPEVAELVGCRPVVKRDWFIWNGWLFTRVRGVREIEPVPFVYDLKVEGDESYMTTAALAHNGGKRKGAACSYMETWHLDVEDFLELRKNTGDERRRTHDMNTANWVPDLFAKRVMENGEWTLFSPNEVPDLHDLYGKAFEERYVEYERMADLGELRQFKRVEANVLWRKMLSMIFETGHPWITFKDPSNVRSPQDHTGVVHSSNLCTEILLNTSAEETAVCNLCSLNLAAHTDAYGLDEEKLAETIETALRMLDNVVDINFYPIPEAQTANSRHRPVGLGLMGFQDALFEQRIGYASEEAVRFADYSMELISYHAILTSSNLAAERGTYASYEGSKWSRGLLPIDTIDLLEEERGAEIAMDRSTTLDWQSVRDSVAKNGMRNSNVMAIAPTATISNISGVYQSIEPTYSNLFVKSNLSGEFTVINPYLVRDLKKRGLWDEEMIEDLKHFDGSVQDIDRVPEDLKRVYLTAFEIDSGWIIDCASRRQKWIDMGQSLNLYLAQPSGKLLSEMYLNAWNKGLKTTYYLRSRGATNVEKSSMDINKRGIQPRWMKSQSASSRLEEEQPSMPMVIQQGETCSPDDPECEACQ